MLFSVFTIMMAFAEESTSAKIPLLYSGLDIESATFRTTASTDVPLESLHPVTIIDLMSKEDIQLLHLEKDSWVNDTVDVCDAANTSNAHIRTLTQTADNFLSYYDLEKASEKLSKAEAGIVCLQEPFNPDDIRQMYYIRGILEQHKGNKDASVQAFSSAIRIKPDLQWNNIYSPDSKPNFDEAKSRFVRLESVPLEIYPTEARSSLWINGAPLLDAEQPEIYVGTNIIQIVGLETKTYEIDIPEDIFSVRLIAPSTTPVSAIDWINSDRSRELSLITNSFLAAETDLYAHNAGQVWHNVVGTTEWTEIEVSKLTEARLNSTEIIGRSLLWTGATTSAVSLGFGLYHYAKGYSAYSITQATGEWDIYEDNATTLESSRGPYRAALISLGSGLLLTGVGYRLTF